MQYRTYEMTITVTVNMPDDYTEHVDEYGESESQEACYSAVNQRVSVPCMLGEDKRMQLWVECEPPVCIETSD